MADPLPEQNTLVLDSAGRTQPADGEVHIARIGTEPVTEPLSAYVRRTRADVDRQGPDWLADRIAELERKSADLEKDIKRALDIGSRRSV